MPRSFFEKWKVWGLSLGKFNTSVPFLPTFPFVPLLSVTSLHTPVLPKIILGFNKQSTHIADKAEFWCHPTPPIRVRYNSHQFKVKRNCLNLQDDLRWACCQKPSQA